MDEDFLDVTNGNKKTIILFVLIVLILIVCGYFFVFKKFYFSAKTVELELGDELSYNVEDYLSKSVSSTRGYKLDLSLVKPNEVGKYTYTITYNKIVRKGKVIVEDTTAPTYTLKELVVEQGNDNFYLGEFLDTCEDPSAPCLVELKNSKDLEKVKSPGEYTVDIVVKDLYGNKSSAEANLKVVEQGKYVDPKSEDLEYASNSLEIKDFKGDVYKKLDKALNPNTDEARDMMINISALDLEKYAKDKYDMTIKSSEIIELYNKSGYVIGYSIQLTLSNDKKVYVKAGSIDEEDASQEEEETEKEPKEENEQ